MRIILDVSTSLAWTRPPVGIVRTEQKFAAFLLGRRDVSVAFCRFDRARRRHVVVPRAVVERRLAGAEAALPPPAPAPGGAAPIEPRRIPGSRARRVAARCVERGVARLPVRLHPEAALVTSSARDLAKALYWLLRKAWHRPAADRAVAVLPPVASPASTDEWLEPRVDDVYVSLGLDWEYNDLDAVAALKREHGFRVLLYCYDLIPVRFPHFMTFDARGFYGEYFRRVAAVADHVVAISLASAHDFRAFLEDDGTPVPPLSVVHLGTDIVGSSAPASCPRAELASTPFVLCVGTIEARKNHELLYNVWDRLVARHGDRTPVLVLVGMVGWGVHDLLARLRVNRRVAERILVLDQVDDGGLLWLYEHCLFTVFPSFCEGLGLPVVESLALGRPCVASNAPSVVEVVRGLVPTLDPLDFPAWSAAIERWIVDEDARRQAALRLRGYRAPSWRRHGEEMLAVIRGMTDAEARVSAG